MRIAFEDTARPSRIAQAIRRHLADRGHRLPAAASRDLVGRMFGYAGWDDLAKAGPADPSPPDDRVPEAERADRRAQYAAALASMGIDPALAERTVAFVSPTGPFDPGALDGFDFLASPPKAAAALAGADAAAFAATPGGARLVRAVQAAAHDDPFWGLRCASRAGVRDGGWLAGALDALRQDPGHPQWPALSLVCAAVASGVMADDHAHAGDLGPLLQARVRRGDLAGLAALLADASETALLALVAHVEDIVGAQVARRAPHRDSLPVTMSLVPSERQPWSPVGTFDLRRPVEGDRTWTLAALNEFGLHPPDAPASVCVRIGDGGRNETGVGLAPAAGDGTGRDDIVIIGVDPAEPLLLAVVRFRADVPGGLFRLDVEGPRRVGEGTEAEWEAACNFLLGVILSRVDGDLRQWGRVVPPGGRLDLLASPATGGADGHFMRDLVRVLGDRFAVMQATHADLGFDLVVRAVGRDGRPRPLPPVHFARVPAGSLEGWNVFEDAFFEAVARGHSFVLAQGQESGLAIGDGAGHDLDLSDPVIDAAVEGMRCEAAEAAVRAVIAEAGLGGDAVLVASADFYAVVSQAKLNDRDWTRGREACIVVEAGPTEGERERLLNGFWATFRPELDAIEAAREGDGLAGVAFHPGSAARH